MVLISSLVRTFSKPILVELFIFPLNLTPAKILFSTISPSLFFATPIRLEKNVCDSLPVPKFENKI